MPPLRGWLQPEPNLSVRSFFSLLEIFIRFVFFFPRPLELWKSFPAPSPGARTSYHGALLWGRAAAGAWVLPPGAQLVPGPVGGMEVAPLRKQRGFTGPVSRFRGAARMRLQCQGPRAEEDKLTRWTLTGWGCVARGSPAEQDHASLCFHSPLCTHPLPIMTPPPPTPRKSESVMESEDPALPPGSWWDMGMLGLARLGRSPDSPV